VALQGIERLPGGILDRHVQERQEGQQGRAKGVFKPQELAGQLLADALRGLAVLELNIGLQEIADREVGDGLAV
jgi:hypothetical protein